MPMKNDAIIDKGFEEMTVAATDEQLALLLQVARAFAFQQMAQGNRLVPFVARAPLDGEIDFIRFVDEDSDLPLDEIYAQTQDTVAEEVRGGQLLAAATVAAVQAGEAEFGAGFATALSVHIEAPGHSRMVLMPYRIDGDELHTGELIVHAAEPAVFAGWGQA